MKKKTYKIGDIVTTELKRLGGDKRIKVTGKIKEIGSKRFGGTYLVTEGMTEDFETRNVIHKN